MASGSVLDFRNEVREEPSLIHHYTFEVHRHDWIAPRLADRAGTDNLSEQIGNLPWQDSVAGITYNTGYDSLSLAGRPRYYYNKIGVGRAWTTTSSIALPPSMTIECLFRPDEIPFPECALVSTRPAVDNRGYYMWLIGSNLYTRVGWGSNQKITSVETGRWYYAACTYTHSGGNTTVNGYFADLTGGGVLQKTVNNAILGGNYGSSGVLGVGCMLNVPVDNRLEYFAPCTIDEVAIYNAAHSYAAISNRLESLRLATPTVEYREIFPNDESILDRTFPAEGWKVHRGASAEEENAVVVAEWYTAFDENLSAVASYPSENGVVDGYLNNHAGATSSNYLYWTDEMTDRLDIDWIKRVDFDTRADTNSNVRIAFRIDTLSTPGDLTDDAWFVSADDQNLAGTGVLPVPASYSYWIRWNQDVRGVAWRPMTFVPETTMSLGDTPVALPTNGLVTAFGFHQDLHSNKKNLRVDNYTVHARRVYPPPPPQGTLVMFK